jgi:hypothetical protein
MSFELSNLRRLWKISREAYIKSRSVSPSVIAGKLLEVLAWEINL